MDIRFLAWAGYQFAQTGEGTAETIIITGCAPEFYGEDIGELRVMGDNITSKAHISSKDLKPKMVAFPRPTV